MFVHVPEGLYSVIYVQVLVTSNPFSDKANKSEGVCFIHIFSWIQRKKCRNKFAPEISKHENIRNQDCKEYFCKICGMHTSILFSILQTSEYKEVYKLLLTKAEGITLKLIFDLSSKTKSTPVQED